MPDVAEALSIMFLSAGFFWGGIPMGLAFHFPLPVAGILTVAGAQIAVLVVLLSGTPIQVWLMRRFPGWVERTRNGRAGRTWQKYGMPGLGLLSPLIPGAPQSAIIALALGAKPARIFFWVSLGIWPWGGIATGSVALGIRATTRLLP